MQQPQRNAIWFASNTRQHRPIILICQQRQSSITHPHACISMKEWPCLFLNQRQLYALLSINHSTCDSGSPWKYRHTTVKGPYLFFRRVLPFRKWPFTLFREKLQSKYCWACKLLPSKDVASNYWCWIDPALFAVNIFKINFILY